MADAAEKAATDRVLLDLFMQNFESMRDSGRVTSEAGTGLAGHVYGGTPEARDMFRAELAELMIEYCIDKVDVAWRVPHVLRHFTTPTRARSGVTDNGSDPISV